MELTKEYVHNMIKLYSSKSYNEFSKDELSNLESVFLKSIDVKYKIDIENE